MTSQRDPWTTVVFSPYDSLLDSEYQFENKTYEIPARRFHMQKPVLHGCANLARVGRVYWSHSRSFGVN